MTLVERTAEVAAALVKVARPIILTEFSNDSCIASTRIGIDVLDYFGVAAVPMPLRIAIFNQEAQGLLSGGMTLEGLHDVIGERGRDMPGGPWSMLVGASPPDSGGWSGHVVIAVPRQRILLDLSIDQASRPHKGLTFDGPLVVPVPDEDWWTRRSDRFAVQIERAAEQITLVLDRDAGPDGEGYRRSPNWRRSGRQPGTQAAFRSVTGRIIRAMRHERSLSESVWP